ncbi:hypothetical protein SOASR030_26240 [Leminorella grimontii]|uniref:Uncharacterized protein n=1 Tax=Leminorella grimontii TaxID=82981 RepID=A0AAV5N435_9GAMM|nr:hypothetical protein SOASR030_26240 [Leminorella grimontii]
MMVRPLDRSVSSMKKNLIDVTIVTFMILWDPGRVPDGTGDCDMLTAINVFPLPEGRNGITYSQS